MQKRNRKITRIFYWKNDEGDNPNLRVGMRISGNVILIIYFALIARVALYFVEFVSRELVVPQAAFLGPILLANFDGVHYLSIAQWGYQEFQQAFFPLFPLLIKSFASVIQNYAVSSIVLVHLFFVGTVLFFWKLARVDFSERQALWALAFFLSFPTSFFLFAVYTEGLFLMLIFASFYFARRKKFGISALLAGCATATRIVGVFMIPVLVFEYIASVRKKGISMQSLISILGISFVSSLGTLSYMFYLWKVYADPLLFMHVQPAFNAGRSGGEIILLPQVLYRYIRMLLTVPFDTLTFWVAVLELGVFLTVIIALYAAFKQKIHTSYVLFAFGAIVLPTLSGTLSSVPRYALVCFPVFLALSMVKNKIVKFTILVSSVILQLVLAAIFMSGYFVS